MGGVSLIIIFALIVIAVIIGILYLVSQGVFSGRRPPQRSSEDGDRPPHTTVDGKHFGPHPERPRTPVGGSEPDA